MSEQIFDRQEQIDYLQKIHWADAVKSLNFTKEEASLNRLKVFVKEHESGNTEEGHYGLYDDALIFEMGEEDFRLDRMEIRKSGYFLTGNVNFSSRKDPFKNIVFEGIQKQTK